MRIMLMISSLRAGGAERVMSLMANYWVAQGHSVTLLTLDGTHDDWYPLDVRVQRVGLDLLMPSAHVRAAIWNNITRFRRLRHEVCRCRPDMVVSFVDRMNTLTLLAVGTLVPVIVSERTDPRKYAMGRMWNVLRTMVYRRAAAVVVQTNAVRPWAARLIAERRVQVIPNPIDPRLDETTVLPTFQKTNARIVAVGRLVQEKGFDVLIRAFHRCSRRHPDWSLTIIGEGEERGTLEALVSQLSLKDRVMLPGLARQPDVILRGADIFVQSSRFEGFPNALLEAMACGVAVISTACAGPSEIIRNGIDGLLVPPDDVEALTSAIECLIDDSAVRLRLAGRALEVRRRFSIDKIMDQWDILLQRTLHNSPPVS
ncbi:glycosyltransferase family 4 protein [Nitrospira sp. Nam74]